MKKPEFIEIVPQYPLPIPIYYKEDYQTWPVVMMKNKGFRVKIITLKKRGQEKKEIIHGVEIMRCTNILNLYLYILQRRNALFYVQGKIFPLFAGLFAKKSIYITHATMGKSLPKYLLNFYIKNIYKFCLSKFKKVITISLYETTLFKQLGFKNNLVYIPNAIDCDFFSKPYGGNEFIKKYKLSTRSKKVVFLGNMHQGDKTNIETLFKAFAIVLQKFPNSKLIVIGKFPDKINKLKELLSITKSVIFTGWLPHNEFIKVFSIADVFVNTSRYEGDPLSVAEAASAKIPLCLSNIPTLKSTYGNTALYHSPNDYHKLSKNVINYFQNPILSMKNSTKTYKKIKITHDISRVKNITWKLFNEVLSKL